MTLLCLFRTILPSTESTKFTVRLQLPRDRHFDILTVFGVRLSLQIGPNDRKRIKVRHTVPGLTRHLLKREQLIERLQQFDKAQSRLERKRDSD